MAETIPMPEVTWKEQVLFNVLRRPVVLANARLGRYEEVIWLLGHPRSGTTWLSELINHDNRLRDMFEPIRPVRVEPTSFLQRNEYMRPRTSRPELHALMSDIFSGRFAHVRVDFYNRRPLYGGLIIKDVFANLLARWAMLEFPQVRPVLIVRNPFAACLSMIKRPRWYEPLSPSMLLSQRDLVEDHLDPYLDVLQRTEATGDELQKNLASWAVTNMIPLRQFPDDELHVCFYEELYRDPESTLANLLDFTSRSESGSEMQLSHEQISKPSRTARGGNVLKGKSPVATWKDELTVEQIDSGLKLLDELGIGELYGENIDPDRSVLNRYRPVE